MPSKADFSLKLVEEGLAMVSQSGQEKRMPSNMMQIQDAEDRAKKQELGIWDKKLKLVSNKKTDSRFKPLE
jgi:endonuclease YncB( thermonuclease family)